MSRTLIAKPTLIATSALLLVFLAGMHNEAASQDMTGIGVVDAHDQARRLLQRPDITVSRSTSVPTVISIARAPALDAQEQARRLLLHPGIGPTEVAAFDRAALFLNPERADAHTLAEHLLLKPIGY